MAAGHSSPQIGTLREKPLHASLKSWYYETGDEVEVDVDGYVIDLVRDDLLIEVQTRGFSALKKKVPTLLDRGHRLRIVHPIPVDKWIVKIDDDGTVLSRRRSPKHGCVIDVFAELVAFPELVTHSNLDIEVILTEEEEQRRHTPNRSWRRNGWSVDERRLIDVVENVLLSEARDYAALLPFDLPELFTTGDLADSLHITRRLSQQMAYCLRAIEVIVALGKRGNAMEYEIVRG